MSTLVVAAMVPRWYAALPVAWPKSAPLITVPAWMVTLVPMMLPVLFTVTACKPTVLPWILPALVIVPPVLSWVLAELSNAPALLVMLAALMVRPFTAWMLPLLTN